MEEIDIKDKKILYNLSLDSRQSLTKLGKKVGLSRELVKYRIKRLQEKEIIKNFITITDSSTYGASFVRFYYTFQNTSPSIKRDLINYLIKHKNTLIIKQIEARYDIEVQYFFTKVQEFRSSIREFKLRYGDYISNEFFSTQLDAQLFDFNFLLGKQKITNRDFLNFNGNVGNINLDKLDIEILRTININARTPTTDLAKNFVTTIFIVNSKIKKLREAGVIKRFGLDIDFTKIGYYFFHVDIDLKRYKGINELIEYYNEKFVVNSPKSEKLKGFSTNRKYD